MTRLLWAVAGAFALSAIAISAQEKAEQQDDPIAAELNAAKKKYLDAVATAAKKMFEAFDKAEMGITEDKNLKPADKLKQLDQLAAERKAFEADGTLPKLARLKPA